MLCYEQTYHRQGPRFGPDRNRWGKSMSASLASNEMSYEKSRALCFKGSLKHDVWLCSHHIWACLYRLTSREKWLERKTLSLWQVSCAREARLTRASTDSSLTEICLASDAERDGVATKVIVALTTRLRWMLPDRVCIDGLTSALLDTFSNSS